MTWKSFKQETMADSTCEFEYIASSEASTKATSIRNFISDLGVVQCNKDPLENKRKMHWVSYDVGGFGLGSLRSMTITLLSKWWWRLKVEDNFLCSSCIEITYKINCIDGEPLAKCGIAGTWLSIYQINKELEE